MKRKPSEDECREAAETLLGGALDEFRPVTGGNSSLNFFARIGTDRWLVKIGPTVRVMRAVGRHKTVHSPWIPGIGCAGRTVGCNQWTACIVEWIDGADCIDPADMTDAQIEDLARAHRELLPALQAVADAKDREPGRGLDAGVPRCVIHGDMNFRNIGFREGRIAVFFDLESLALGFPTEDLLRVPLHAMERTRFWWFRRMRRLESCLVRLIRASGYSAQAWLAAVGAYERIKTRNRAEKSRYPLFKAVERFLRAPLYRRIRTIIRREAEC